MQLPWMADVRVGDVLEDANGTQRVVREVKRYKDGELRSVCFAIRRCSWTGRCYTILGYTDLRYRGYRKVGRTRMGSAIDWKIYKEIGNVNKPRVSCCEVRGVP
jgi:hypothetical protein